MHNVAGVAYAKMLSRPHGAAAENKLKIKHSNTTDAVENLVLGGWRGGKQARTLHLKCGHRTSEF